MAKGTNDDPILIDPTYRFAAALLSRLFSKDDDVTKFIHAVSPQIRSAVAVGEFFAFSVRPDSVFQLREDENNALYFVRWPSNGGWKYYLETEDEARPWLSDRIEEFNKAIRNLNPFSHMDKFMDD